MLYVVRDYKFGGNMRRIHVIVLSCEAAGTVAFPGNNVVGCAENAI